MIFEQKILFFDSVLLLCSAHEYASHVNWIHCFAFQVPNCTQLVTFFVQTHAAAARPHSHEPFILLPRLTWAKVQKTSETKIGTQSIYSEITIREASIKMRETYKLFSILFICGRACILRRICLFKGPEEQ